MTDTSTNATNDNTTTGTTANSAAGTNDSKEERSLQDELKDTAHRIWLAGLGALAAAEEEGSKLFSRLVDRGRDVESRGKVEVDKVVDRAKNRVDEVVGQARTKAGSTWEEWGGKLDDTLTAALHRLGVPTREEIQRLTKRVEELNSKVELLRPRVTQAGSGAGANPTPVNGADDKGPAARPAKSSAKVV
jgi:poly(hydroxyalkanoate) granule-associated protein